MNIFANSRRPLAVVALIALAAFNAACAADTNNAAASPTNRPAMSFADEVVARGPGFEITRSQLDEEIVRVKADLARLNRPVRPDEHLLVDRQVLENMIKLRLLLAKATEDDRTNARAIAQRRFEMDRTNAVSEEAFRRQLKVAGLTPELALARLTDAITADAVLVRELNVTISDEEVRKYYDENPAHFEQPETVRVAHILFRLTDASGAPLAEEEKLAKLKKAEEVKKRLREGADFGELAKEYSEDPATKDRGGELPQPLPRGIMRPELPEFEAVAFSLATNQVSDIVATRVGYHIIKVLEKQPARIIEFEKVADNIRQLLKAREIQRRSFAYLDKLKQEAGVEILDEKLKSVALPFPPAPDATR